MSFWTKNRKKILPAAGLLALQFVPGVGQAVSAGLLGAAGAAEGAAGGLLAAEGAGALAGVAEGAGALAGAGEAATAGQGLLGTMASKATAAAVPGLTSAAPGSQAAMLAAQNSGFGLHGLAQTAQAGAGPTGVSPMAQMGTQALGGASRGLGLLGDVASGGNKVQQGMGLLGGPPQSQAPMPPPVQRPQQAPTPSMAGYGQGLPPELMSLPPNHPVVMEWMKQRGMA